MARKKGSPRADTLTGTSGADHLLGEAGRDTLAGRNGNDVLDGGAGNDLLDGGAGNDKLFGGAGTDRLVGRDGNDVLDGGAGNDQIQGGNGGDRLYGQAGNDLLDGWAGLDQLFGQAGNDVLEFDGYDLRVDGGAGTDTLRFVLRGEALDLGGFSAGRLVDLEVVDLTGAGNNTLFVTRALLQRLSSSSDTLRVTGNRGDVVTLGDTSAWSHVSNVVVGGQTFARYTKAGATLLVDTEVRVKIAVSLGALAGADGFKISGETPDGQLGRAVAGAGDVNGDGFDDFILAAADAWSGFGANYVVYGGAGGFPANFNLGSLDGANGFEISGAMRRLGREVAAAGDVNGDGFADLLMSDRDFGFYVVLGGPTGTAAQLDPLTLDGTNGFTSSYITDSIAALGDLNGDGYADFGAVQRGSRHAGVMFGHAGPFAADVEFPGLDPTRGFHVRNDSDFDADVSAIGSAGDFNGDGYDDFLVGIARADDDGVDSGSTYVIFGTDAGFDIFFNLANLDAARGFRITGDTASALSGRTVASAGDINGDGYDDLLIGSGHRSFGDAPLKSYVVFGAASGFSASFSLADLDGTNGFVIGDRGPFFGRYTVTSGVGDVNGDGYADILVAAPTGIEPSRPSLASAFLIYGKAGGFAATIDPSKVAGVNGLEIRGTDARALAGAGDVNGDGFADILIGNEGSYLPNSSRGAAYMLFGQDFFADGATVGGGGDNVLLGTAGADRLIGAQGNDRLTGAAGADVLLGGVGDDTLEFDLLDRVVDGGGGIDRAALQGSGVSMILNDRGTPGAFLSMRDVEIIDLTGSGDNALQLTRLDVLNMSDNANLLRVDGDVGDSLSSVGQGWTADAVVAVGATQYQTYTSGAANLWVDLDVAATVS